MPYQRSVALGQCAVCTPALKATTVTEEAGHQLGGKTSEVGLDDPCSQTQVNESKTNPSR